MADEPVILDERARAVADTGSRWAYMLLSFGVLIDATVRGVVRDEAAWDLLGLVFVSSAVGSLYMRFKRVQVLPRRFLLILMILSAVVGLVVAVGAVLLTRLHR